MPLILSWVAFPVVLALVGIGWGGLAERLSGRSVHGALLLPLGLAAVVVVAGTLTAFDATARAATPVVVIGTAVGLLLSWPRRARFRSWGLVGAVAVLAAYGAPILLSGQATFAGFIKLDDTATWFSVVDHVMSHSRSVSSEPLSTFSLEFSTDIGKTYPLGSFVVLGAVRPLVGVDVAWVFQPYLAFCGAMVALCLYALAESLVPARRLRALVAFLAAQAALLYGYSLWGGIKEMTAAFLLVLMAALAAEGLRERHPRPRALIPFAIAAAALVQALGAGAAAWVLPTLGLVAAIWLLRGHRSGELRASATSVGSLAGLTAAFMVPVWAVISSFVSNRSSLFSNGQSLQTQFGNLGHSLSAFQLAGIWPVGDFRSTPPTPVAAPLIGLALVAALVTLIAGIRRRQLSLALYVLAALVGCAVIYLAGATPWVVAKALAISAPAVIAMALTGAAMLLLRRRRLGVVVFAALAFGVLWSNALAYHDVILAPRSRLAELQRIGDLVSDRRPTLLNEYEVYGDRHFLRAGAPTEPAEYRPALLALNDGTLLTKSAAADIDSFPLATVEGYRSIVTPRSPAESRPPSNYRLVWRGHYYDLWQRSALPSTRILEHVPFGESNTLPYCGAAENGPSRPECSANPVAVPPCSQILELAESARERHANLVAYRRAAPIVARGDQTLWPGSWLHDPAAHSLTPTTPGTAVSHIAVASAQTYGLWLDGSFSRGFEVSVDGRPVGKVEGEPSAFARYIHVADVTLLPGIHKFSLTYPHSDLLTPGSGENEFTLLSAITLQPTHPAPKLITLAPAEASRFCGQPLDWIEIVARAHGS